MKKTICIGDAVQSIQGRDTGKVYIVLNVDCDYVRLANGFDKHYNSPKKKNVKHVRLIKPGVLDPLTIKSATDLNAKLHFVVAQIKGN